MSCAVCLTFASEPVVCDERDHLGSVCSIGSIRWHVIINTVVAAVAENVVVVIAAALAIDRYLRT
jgi:hypothetical protein